MSGTIIIAFEGIDGSGKTVQMNHLERALIKRGMRVETLSFPIYSSFFGRHVGQYLTCADGVSASEVDGKSMALWFALDRFEALRRFNLDGVDVLLINRYVLSNAVYQSIRDRDLGRPDLLDFVQELEHGHFGIPVPNVYVYLDVYTEDAEKNVLQKGYRDYAAGMARDVYEAQTGIQQRARQKYLQYAEQLDNVLVIPCMEEGLQKKEKDIAMLVEDALMRFEVF